MEKFDLYPTEFLIVVRGSLSLNWSDKLAGMSITTTGGKGRVTISTLKGELLDQAALIGVLNTLHDLNYQVIKVECEKGWREKYGSNRDDH